MGLLGEGGQDTDAMLLRMNFEDGEVEEIRDWIRRCYTLIHVLLHARLPDARFLRRGHVTDQYIESGHQHVRRQQLTVLYYSATLQ